MSSQTNTPEDGAARGVGRLLAQSDAREGNACDREAVHAIPRLQAGGALVVLTTIDFVVRHASEGAQRVFSTYNAHGGGAGAADPANPRGLRLSELAGRELALAVESKWKAGALKPRSRYLFRFGMPPLDVNLFVAGEGALGVEVMPAALSPGDPAKFLQNELLTNFLAEIPGSASKDALWNRTCHVVRQITGMDRVMLYRFLAPSWHGEVVAEDKNMEAYSLLHHRFPASDIPAPARALYLKNKVRYIADSLAPEEEVLVGPAGPALDLTHSRRRGVSTQHLRYLANMGVRASLSIAIEAHGRLWGLIACHAAETRPLSFDDLAVCETISNVLSTWVPMLEINGEREEKMRIDAEARRLVQVLSDADDPRDRLLREAPAVYASTGASGLALVTAGAADINGRTPLRADVLALANWLESLDEYREAGLFACDSLAERNPDFERLAPFASGLLACRLRGAPAAPAAHVLLFRPEAVKQIKWGGDPREALAKKGFGGDINPRASFETWLEEIRGRSEPWSPAQIDAFRFTCDVGLHAR